MSGGEHIMKARIDLMHVSPGIIHAMLGLERNVAARTVPGDYVPGNQAALAAASGSRT